ncbi:MAG: 50S ribosomal protein L15 [Patescibacteria group bacterium]|nr:50S ribosomal protein L15 [Patescibacteria group bacterium]
MQLHNLSSKKSSRHKSKRVGRGIASGKGKTCGRGGKGQTARQGKRKFYRGFEGGQIPLYKRMPNLRGFRNPNRTSYQVVNLKALEDTFKAEDTITKAKLVAKNLIAKMSQPIKLLGTGNVTKKFIVQVDAASQSAIKKIEQAGGKVELKPARKLIEDKFKEKFKKEKISFK